MPSAFKMRKIFPFKKEDKESKEEKIELEYKPATFMEMVSVRITESRNNSTI